MSTMPASPSRRYLSCILLLASLIAAWYFYRADANMYFLISLALAACIGIHVTIRNVLVDTTVVLLLTVAFFLLPSVVLMVRDSVFRMIRGTNMRNVILGFHKYHDEQAKLPSLAIKNATGTPLLSWRVAILPYLGEETLYKQFKLDEPWSSPHNLALLPLIPKCYQPVGKRFPAGCTHLVALTGPGTVFAEKTTTLQQVKDADGCSHTAILAESGRFIPWTMPDDEVVDPAQPSPFLDAYPDNRFASQIGFLDANVRSLFLSKGFVDMKKLRILVTWNGKEVFDDEEVLQH